MNTQSSSLSAKKAQQQTNVYGSVEELARDLGISRMKAYHELRNGQIPAIRLGRRFVIPRSAIEQWLKSAGGRV